MTSDPLAIASKLVQSARSVTVLTGAGVSAESGLSTFRGAGGYWKGASAMELASPDGFRRNPQLVWEWYNERRRRLKEVKPNPAHFAIARIEAQTPEFGLITQNVDRLHHAAGSRNIIELHGNIWEASCTDCRRVFDRTYIDLSAEPRCEECDGWLRPGVVWFGEPLPEGAFDRAGEWTMRANVFLVVGTSGVVYPAAGLAALARHAGTTVIEVNLEASESQAADIFLKGKAGEVLPLLLE